MAPCINSGPFVDALASIRTGSLASLPSGVMNTRSVDLDLVGRRQRVRQLRACLEMTPELRDETGGDVGGLMAGASKLSPGLSPEGGAAEAGPPMSGGSPSNTWYLMERSGSGGT